MRKPMMKIIINARNTFRELNDKYKEEIKGEAEKVREAGGLYITGYGKTRVTPY